MTSGATQPIEVTNETTSSRSPPAHNGPQVEVWSTSSGKPSPHLWNSMSMAAWQSRASHPFSSRSTPGCRSAAHAGGCVLYADPSPAHPPGVNPSALLHCSVSLSSSSCQNCSDVDGDVVPSCVHPSTVHEGHPLGPAGPVRIRHRRRRLWDGTGRLQPGGRPGAVRLHVLRGHTVRQRRLGPRCVHR